MSEAVLRGPQGVLAVDCLAEVWTDRTAPSPVLMRDLAAEFDAKGGQAVDAAIRGDVARVVGGEEAAIGSAMVTAKLAGPDPAIWWEVMKAGAADRLLLSRSAALIFAGQYDPSVPIALCLQDLSLIKQVMDEVCTPNTRTKATCARVREAGKGYGRGTGR